MSKFKSVNESLLPEGANASSITRSQAIAPDPDLGFVLTGGWQTANAFQSAILSSDNREMTTALTSDVGFDYGERVFGDQDIIDTSAHSWCAVRMQRCLDSLADIRGSVLEVGCGAGRCIRTVARHRSDLTCFGCDIAERAIQSACSHADGVTYQQADANRLPYDDNTFAAIVVMDLIEHVPDVAAVLREISRVAKPGAILHLHVPCEGHFLSVYFPLLTCGIDLTHKTVGHLHHFKRKQVRELLEAEGFTIVKVGYSMYLFGQIHDLIGWWNMLSGKSETIVPEEESQTGEQDAVVAEPFRIKHLISRPAWWAASRILPLLQSLELRLLSWQSLGAVGLCTTSRNCKD